MCVASCWHVGGGCGTLVASYYEQRDVELTFAEFSQARYSGTKLVAKILFYANYRTMSIAIFFPGNVLWNYVNHKVFSG